MFRSFYKNIVKQHPTEPLFAGALADTDGMVGYPSDIEHEMFETCSAMVGERLPQEKFFRQGWSE